MKCEYATNTRINPSGNVSVNFTVNFGKTRSSASNPDRVCIDDVHLVTYLKLKREKSSPMRKVRRGGSLIDV